MWKRVALLVAILLTASLTGKQVVFTFEEMQPYFDAADEETLVIFDVDLVLLIPKEPALQLPNIVRHRDIAHRHYRLHPPEVRSLIKRLMITEFEDRLVEEQSVAAIADLQARGVPTMALTAAWTAKGLVEERFKRLVAHEIDFSSLYPDEEWLFFDQFVSETEGAPAYFRGILFTNGHKVQKGELLAAFLDQIGKWPTRVIFVDDLEENLDSVGQMLTERGVDHILFWYKGGTHFPSEPVTAEEMEAVWSGLAERAVEAAACPT